jgi:hypothetical protein
MCCRSENAFFFVVSVFSVFSVFNSEKRNTEDTENCGEPQRSEPIGSGILEV